MADILSQALEASAAKPLRKYFSRINFVIADPTGSDYPLPSDSFDLIISNAVLQFVQDMSKFASEVERLLNKGGYFFTIIHNFYSISGSHILEWAYPDEHPSKNIPPWDHLRENRFPPWENLNRFRPEQYTAAFANLEILRFEGVGIDHDAGKPEGERFLTAEIAAELAAYPRELLLTRFWCLICRKI